MRFPSAFLALALASCATGGATGGNGSGDAAPDLALTPDLFPLTPRTQRYAMTRGESRSLRLAPSESGSTLWLEGGTTPRRIDVTATPGGLAFGGEADSRTELLRFGAQPGSEWDSGSTRVRFTGWERIEVPAGLFDVARVETSIPGRQLRHDETWWFARDVGIVRLRSDYGGLFTEEMSLRSR